MAHLRSALDSLIQEIRKTFDFFKETSSMGGIQRIYLAGGLANMPGLGDILQGELHSPCEVMNPFLRVTFKDSKLDDGQLREMVREMAPRLGVALGLALRSFD